MNKCIVCKNIEECEKINGRDVYICLSCLNRCEESRTEDNEMIKKFEAYQEDYISNFSDFKFEKHKVDVDFVNRFKNGWKKILLSYTETYKGMIIKFDVYVKRSVNGGIRPLTSFFYSKYINDKLNKLFSEKFPDLSFSVEASDGDDEIYIKNKNYDVAIRSQLELKQHIENCKKLSDFFQKNCLTIP